MRGARYRPLGGRPPRTSRILRRWIALTVGAGLLVGLLRRWLQVPIEPNGALESIAVRHVDQRSAIPMILVSWVSLVGGASLGPFDAGVRSGGAVGEWFSDRVGAEGETRKLNTLVGINGAIGGLLTSPVLATLLVTELNPPERHERYYRTVAPSLVASVFGFFVVFTFVGATFVDVFAVPSYEIEYWHFGVAVLLGVVGAFLSRLLGATVFVLRTWFTRIPNTVVRAGVGGLAVGLIAVFFPLTLGSGKAQLPDMINQADELGALVLVGIVLAKIVAMATSLATGFIGGAGHADARHRRRCRCRHPRHHPGPADRVDPVVPSCRRTGGVDQGPVLDSPPRRSHRQRWTDHRCAGGSRRGHRLHLDH